MKLESKPVCGSVNMSHAQRMTLKSMQNPEYRVVVAIRVKLSRGKYKPTLAPVRKKLFIDRTRFTNSFLEIC